MLYIVQPFINMVYEVRRKKAKHERKLVLRNKEEEKRAGEKKKKRKNVNACYGNSRDVFSI